MPDDVTFTYKSGGTDITKTLKWNDRIKSREALGLWKVDSKAWKVYSTTKELEKLKDDYRRAAVDAGLPMGSPAFQQGTVKQGKDSSEGFVLITKWMEGKKFVKKASAFKAALKEQSVSHSKSSTDYKRIKGGCDGAKTIGLKDCQGFVEASTSTQAVGEPVCFIDVHTSWNSKTKKYGTSSLADELVEVIDKWGESSDSSS